MSSHESLQTIREVPIEKERSKGDVSHGEGGSHGLQQHSPQQGTGMQQTTSSSQQQQQQRQEPVSPRTSTAKEGSSLLPNTTQYEVSTLKDEEYEPQERIANMRDSAKRAFMGPYQIRRFNGKLVKNDPYENLLQLANAHGVRVVNFPIQNEYDTASALATTATPAQLLQMQNDEESEAPFVVAQTGSDQYQKGYVVTKQGWKIHATSCVYQLQHSSGPLKADFFETNTTLKTGAILAGIMFVNTVQIPAERNIKGLMTPAKPCMHLFTFGNSSNLPLLIAERDLKLNRKVRVFNSRLELFGEIETTSRLGIIGKKMTIYGPDLETPIYVLKAAKFITDQEIYIKERKRRVGLITNKFVTPNFLPVGSKDAPSHDIFFPVDADWSRRAMLMVATFYLDYLWFD